MSMVPECFDLESEKDLFFSSETGVRDTVSDVIEENWLDFSAAEEFSELSAGEQRARIEADLQDVQKNKTLSTGRRERLVRFFSLMKNLVSLSAKGDSEQTECGDSANLEYASFYGRSCRGSRLIFFSRRKIRRTGCFSMVVILFCLFIFIYSFFFFLCFNFCLKFFLFFFFFFFFEIYTAYIYWPEHNYLFVCSAWRRKSRRIGWWPRWGGIIEVARESDNINARFFFFFFF